MNIERWLTIFQSVVESRVEQRQPPPEDIQQQIEYYKEAFRTVHRISQGRSDSHSGSRRNTSEPVDQRSESIPAPPTPNECAVSNDLGTSSHSQSIGQQGNHSASAAHDLSSLGTPFRGKNNRRAKASSLLSLLSLLSHYN